MRCFDKVSIVKTRFYQVLFWSVINFLALLRKQKLNIFVAKLELSSIMSPVDYVMRRPKFNSSCRFFCLTWFFTFWVDVVLLKSAQNSLAFKKQKQNFAPWILKTNDLVTNFRFYFFRFQENSFPEWIVKVGFLCKILSNFVNNFSGIKIVFFFLSLSQTKSAFPIC